MARKIGWNDDTVTGGYGEKLDRSRQYRGKKGERHVLRVVTEAEEVRVHTVGDVLDPKADGSESVFYINCSREWNEETKDYEGDCFACEKEYPVQSKYVCGVLLLAVTVGRNPKPTIIPPDNSPMFWDFGGEKYRTLRDIQQELANAEPPKKLMGVDLVVKLDEADPSAVNFQKLKIQVSQAKSIATAAHGAAWKAQGPKLIEDFSKVPSIDEQKRRLKKKTKTGAAAAAAAPEEEAPAESVGDPEMDALLDADLGLDAPAEEPAPPVKKVAKKVATKAPAAKAPAAAPAKAAAKPAAKPAAKKAPEPEPEPEETAEPEADASTGDDTVDDLLNELEG